MRKFRAARGDIVSTANVFGKMWGGPLALAVAGVGLTSVAQAGVDTWSGGSTVPTNNWTDAGNWVAGTAPLAGDGLIFDGTTQTTTNNDFAAGTAFGGLNFAVTAGVFNLTGNAITLNGNVLDNATGAQAVNLGGIAMSGTTNFTTVQTSGALTIGSPISGSGFGINVNGSGNVILTANNSYTGATTISGGGALTVNFGPNSPTSVLNASTTVIIGNGAFNMIGGATPATTTVNGLTLNAGNSAITQISNGSTETLNLGGITQSSRGSVVDFSSPADGSAITTTTANANPAGGQQTILGGYATFGRSSWAVSGTGATAGTITALTNYDTAFTAGKDVDAPASFTVPAGALTINSLRISNNSVLVTLGGPTVIATGGILYSAAAGGNSTITGSTLTSNSGTLYINDRTASGTSASTITIASQITGNTNVVLGGDGYSNGLSGEAQFMLTSTADNYVGTLFINSGRLNFANAASLGNASNPIVITGGPQGGGQLFSGNIAIAATHAISISGVGYPESVDGRSYGAIRVRNTISSPITLTGNARIATTSSGVLAGPISGPFELSLEGDGANTVTFTNTGNSWSGGTRLEGGRVILGAINALPQSTIVTFGTTYTANTLGAPRSIASPTLDLNGFATTIGGAQYGANVDGNLPFSGTAAITNGGAAATLTVNSSTSTTFLGQITNGTNALHLNKTGSGTFALGNSNNNYSGNTTVAAGTLQLLAGASIGNTVNIVLPSTGTLDVSAFGAGGYAINGSQNVIDNGGVVAGTLSLNGTLTGPGSLAALNVITNGGSNTRPGAAAADGNIGTLSATSLSINGGDFRFDAPSTSGYDSITATAVTFNGGSTISIVPGAGIGTYTLFSSPGLNLNGNQPSLAQGSFGRAGYALDFSDPTKIQLIVSGTPGALTWNNSPPATGNGTDWDVQNQQNFLNTATNQPDQYIDGDRVTFNDANNAHYAVNVVGGVNPLSMTVSNTGGPYIFSGDAISGPATLTKTGAGGLTINNSNSYSGGTLLNGGTVTANSGNAFGSGAVTLASGTLLLGNGSAINGALSIAGGTIDNTSGGDISLNNGGAITGNFTYVGATNALALNGTTALANNPVITVAGNTLTTQTLTQSSNSGFTKTGAGTLVLAGAGSYTGTTTILGGVVQLNGTNTGALGSGPLTINGGTLDLSGLSVTSLNLGPRLVSLAGAGVATADFPTGEGAIFNNNQAEESALENVILTADATIGTVGSANTGRIDVGRAGSNNTLNLNGHTLTKIGSGQFTLTGANASAVTVLGPGNIVISQGTFSMEQGTNTPANATITYLDGTTAGFFAAVGNLLNNIVIGNGSPTQGTAGVIMLSSSATSTLGGNINLQDVLNITSANPMVLNGNISESFGPQAINKTGGGAVTFAGNNSYTGGTTVASGTLTAGKANSLGRGLLTLNGGNVTTNPGFTGAMHLAGVTISSGSLDMNNNDLIVDYAAGAKDSTLSAIQGYLKQGYSGGNWNGGGIQSVAANASATHETALGFGDAADLGIAADKGTAITGNAILVKYTDYGDSSLDGKVDLGNDFNLFLIGLLSGATTWELGDYNYDNVVDDTDFHLFIDGFVGQGNSLGELDSAIEGSPLLSNAQKAHLLAVVPEPSSIVAISAVAGMFAARRRRR